MNEPGTAEIDAQGRITGGTLGKLVFRYVYDGLGRIIRKYRIEADGITALRYEDYYYDGIRRVQDVVRNPLTTLPPPPPCDETPAVRFDGTRDPRWVEAVGDVLGVTLAACDYGPDPNAPTYTGPTYESWTDREYIYGTNDVDEFILQIDRNNHFVYMLQDAGLNVVALVDDEGSLIRQDTYAPYGELISTDLFSFDHAPSSVGFKGLFFDSFHTSPRNAPLAPEVAGVYQNRNRTYNPHLGRFMQRDPNETAMPIIAAELSQAQTFAIAASAFDAGSLYGDGMNLFQFAGSNPITGRDPLGLESYGSLMTASFGRALLFSISNIAVGAGFGALGGAGSAWYNNQNITDGALHGAQIGAVFGAGFSAGALTTAYAASASGLFGTATVGTSYAIGGVGGATGGMAAGEYADPNGDSGGHIADAMFAMVDSVATEGLLNVLGGWKPDSSPLLGTRVREIHGALDDIAQRQRTTAILETSNGTRIIAGGGRDLTPAQRALLAPGEVVAKLPGEHAEITALQYAKQNGLVPSEIAVSRNICPECVAAIEAAGGQMTSGTTASFP